MLRFHGMCNGRGHGIRNTCGLVCEPPPPPPHASLPLLGAMPSPPFLCQSQCFLVPLVLDNNTNNTNNYSFVMLYATITTTTPTTTPQINNNNEELRRSNTAGAGAAPVDQLHRRHPEQRQPGTQAALHVSHRALHGHGHPAQAQQAPQLVRESERERERETERGQAVR